MPFLWHSSTNGKLRILVKAQPAPQAPGHCHQLGLAYGRETWVYPTNTLSATVAFLLLPDTNLLPQVANTVVDSNSYQDKSQTEKVTFKLADLRTRVHACISIYCYFMYPLLKCIIEKKITHYSQLLTRQHSTKLLLVFFFF